MSFWRNTTWKKKDQSTWICSLCVRPSPSRPKNTQKTPKSKKKGHRLGSCVPDFYDRILMYIWWIWRKTICPIICSYSQPLKIIIWMTFRRFTDEKKQLFDKKRKFPKISKISKIIFWPHVQNHFKKLPAMFKNDFQNSQFHFFICVYICLHFLYHVVGHTF